MSKIAPQRQEESAADTCSEVTLFCRRLTAASDALTGDTVKLTGNGRRLAILHCSDASHGCVETPAKQHPEAPATPDGADGYAEWVQITPPVLTESIERTDLRAFQGDTRSESGRADFTCLRQLLFAHMCANAQICAQTWD